MEAGRRGSLWGARVVLVCTLALTMGAAWLVHAYDRAALDQHLLRVVERSHLDLEASVRMKLLLLQGLLGLFEASTSVTPEEFRTYVGTLDIRRSQPSLLGLGYAERVTADEVPALEREMRAEGEPGFRVWPATREEGYPILYLEPRDRGNQAAIGYDMFSEPTRRAGLERARDTGEPVASDTLTLVQEQGRTAPGFLIFLPLYRGGAPVDTVAERRAAIQGFVYAPVRVRELLGGAGLREGALAVRAYDGPDPSVDPVIFDLPPVDGWSRPVQRPLTIAGRTWCLEYQFRVPLYSWWRTPALAVLVTGTALSFALFRLQVVQVRARLRAEEDAEALREGQHRYRFLAEVMPQIVFSVDAGGRISFANRRWKNAAVGETLRANLARDVHGDDREAALTSWEESRTTGRTWEATFRLRPAADEGYGWRLASACPQRRNGRVEQWVGSLTDIDSQKAAEEALQRSTSELERRVEERTAELQRSNRELQNFAAVASHDLQEPLRKIVAFGDRLAAELGSELSPTAADALHRMRRSAERLQRLIRDLLAFARISRAEVVPEAVDLEALAREVVAELLEGDEGAAEVRIEPIPRAQGDPGLLRQLLENLLGNALKFHAEGAIPHVRVASEDAGEEVPPEDRAAWFRLLVEDRGIGFDPKYLDRIFQMFQRLHPRDRYEGTGIGLAICQRVAELHGGHITARSSPGAGATFVVTLPRAPVGRAAGETSARGGVCPVGVS